MQPRHPRSTRTDTLLPYPTLYRSYVINGQKMWVTNGHRAGVYLAMTKTDTTANPRHKGITAFLVDAGTPGFTAGRRLEKLGRSEEHTYELQSLMRTSYAVFCLKKQKRNNARNNTTDKNHRLI